MDGYANGFISFRGVGFRYSEDGPFITHALDLEIRRQEFFTLLGPSGCGKTTLLNLLAGYETPTEGEVCVSGKPVRGPGRDRIVIFQAPDSLYPWLTALENVDFPLRVAGLSKKERQVRALQVIELVGLHGHESKYPGQLSGGMKQRVQLARALVLEAPILLMDEPFGALDAQTRAVLQDELVQIQTRTQRTALFITHDISEAIFLADRVGVMSAGPQACIKEIIEVTLPRPRSRGSAAFGQLYDRVNQILSDEVRRVLRREDSLL
ncbi:MAG: ABC transporter ATP-binding protein [Candidatus Rokubacteria bacterium]|nr:ABC transporter ATP-binding protein [Candidatus Rokubacteria bacterium]